MAELLKIPMGVDAQIINSKIVKYYKINFFARMAELLKIPMGIDAQFIDSK